MILANEEEVIRIIRRVTRTVCGERVNVVTLAILSMVVTAWVRAGLSIQELHETIESLADAEKKTFDN